MKADVNTYTLKVIYNPPGFHPITIELSQHGRGVIKELNGSKFHILMRDLAKWMLESEV